MSPLVYVLTFLVLSVFLVPIVYKIFTRTRLATSRERTLFVIGGLFMAACSTWLIHDPVGVLTIKDPGGQPAYPVTVIVLVVGVAGLFAVGAFVFAFVTRVVGFGRDRIWPWQQQFVPPVVPAQRPIPRELSPEARAQIARLVQVEERPPTRERRSSDNRWVFVDGRRHVDTGPTTAVQATGRTGQRRARTRTTRQRRP